MPRRLAIENLIAARVTLRRNAQAKVLSLRSTLPMVLVVAGLGIVGPAVFFLDVLVVSLVGLSSSLSP